ncbi:hypothetical protein SLS56_002647 [Neofusicoccum ribis]|uniref:Cytochrome P450 n=1 Tax=Neofusicoccum ribis TaxID=45134 RepID=A0ABR3T361_9PEZI
MELIMPFPALTALQLGLVASLVGLLATALAAIRIGKRPEGLPPGRSQSETSSRSPKPALIFGKFTEWSKKYGGLISLQRFGNTSIVINDWFYVKNLLDKKSNIYSNRPKNHIAHLITGSDNVAMMQYGDTWRKMRKLIHQAFMESTCDKEHCKIQEAEATQMLYDFLTRPEENMLHPRRFSNSMTTSTGKLLGRGAKPLLIFAVLGWRAKDTKDEHMLRLYEILEKWSVVLEVGANPPLDAIPFLKYVPEWLLGGWRTRATEVKNLMEGLYYEVLGKVRARREGGVNLHSFVDRVLDQQEKNQFGDHQLAFLIGVLLEGGSDTSSSLILAIVRAMMQYPDVQKKAQAEIDSVIGSDRSPRWSDFSKLPYINMIIKEAHRWRPVLPLGVSHAVSQDDTINGMRLPKDSEVIINVWALHNDPKKWESPERFMPERYRDYPELAPFYAASPDFEKRDHVGYGASRRICPGIHLAERNLFIGTAKLLWAFRFSADPEKEAGAATEGHGFIHCVDAYQCNVELRDEAKRATILRELEEARAVFELYE